MVECLTKSATNTAKVKPIGWHDHPFFLQDGKRRSQWDINEISIYMESGEKREPLLSFARLFWEHHWF
jgi:hypothetical protein